MKMKLFILSAKGDPKAESKVNDWLAENNITPKFVTQSESRPENASLNVTIAVWY